MQRNMHEWRDALLRAEAKKPMPILSFPGAALLGISVKELLFSAENQADAMAAVAARTDSAASVSLMDLSVEAECFGAPVHVSEEEVPTVTGRVIHSPADAETLRVPPTGAGRTGICIEAIRLASRKIADRPVFAGVIGPFSLAGRLTDVTEAMIDCYEEPEMMHTVLAKATDFLIGYIRAFKEAGADGVVIAEPLAGLLPPDLAEEFSARYVKKINDAVKEPSFLTIYHNCGNTALLTIGSILSTDSDAYHFGNAIDMTEMLGHVPADTLVFGNLDPAGILRNGDPETVKRETAALLKACGGHKNFVLSSGCDIPPATPWENIDAFFADSVPFPPARKRKRKTGRSDGLSDCDGNGCCGGFSPPFPRSLRSFRNSERACSCIFIIPDAQISSRNLLAQKQKNVANGVAVRRRAKKSSFSAILSLANRSFRLYTVGTEFFRTARLPCNTPYGN